MENKIGEVSALFHYLVKGMRGISLQSSDIGWHGLVQDRKFAFYDPSNTSGFPWSTGRKQPHMILYKPSVEINNDGKVNISDVMIETPTGNNFRLDDPDLQSEVSNLFGFPVQIFSQGRGCFDAMPLSLLSTSTLTHLGEKTGINLSPRRFRPNMVVDLLKNTPYGEEEWLGKTIRFGEGETAPSIRFDRKNIRCSMVNIDPDSAERNSAVLKEIVSSRDKATAIYGTPVNLGKISVGDGIYLL